LGVGRGNSFENGYDFGKIGIIASKDRNIQKIPSKVRRFVK
jgi:hypothetical protein